ncbi:MAG TPA: serine/threonine-protein kinase [Thermoanaerobaculia bacterium]
MQLEPTSRLAHYEIVSLLGRGGMGEVYRALDTRLGREVALKVLPSERGEATIRLARFEREAKTLAALDHPGIVTVFSVEEAQGVPFLTMQLIEGTTLSHLIPNEGLSASRVIELAIPLADALAAAHEKEIVHRDIKPGNVMVTADGRVKVLDFGLARKVEARAVVANDPTLVHGPTQQGQIVGTLPYMSPEQIEGRDLGPASDVFALGVMLYEMSTGSRPFRGDSPPALISSILKDAPPPPSQISRTASRELDHLIACCLEKEPSRRITAQQLRDSLVAIRDAASESRRPSRIKLPVLAGIALAGIALLVLASIAVSRSRRAAFVAESIPRIEQFARELKFVEGFALATEVERRGGAVPAEAWEATSSLVSVSSAPSGAAISIRPIGSEDSWTSLGERLSSRFASRGDRSTGARR